jgi:hypothetical protein
MPTAAVISSADAWSRSSSELAVRATPFGAKTVAAPRRSASRDAAGRERPSAIGSTLSLSLGGLGHTYGTVLETS